jgi:hypothetical protein
METIVFITLDDETREVEHRLPARYVVCSQCEGRGTHDHPAFSNGITSDEWHGPDWDDESRESYLRGDYDVPCTTCDGKRVVLEADEERFTPEQRKVWEEHLELEREIAADDASERYLRCAESGGHNG